MQARLRTLALVGVLLSGGWALRGDGTQPSRYQRLGEQLICTCGCTQGALVCNHVGCPVVTQMQAEIRQRAQLPESDDLILQSFVQEYGTQVLANPTHKGFNQVAWVTPWVAVGLGLMLVLWYVRRWHHEQEVPAAAADAGTQALIQKEIQAEIDKEWED